MNGDDNLLNPGRPPASGAGPSDDCQIWEAALTDLLDGTLAPEEEAAFRAHAADCSACQVLLEECGHGQAWARLLHDTPPAVPDTLLGKILIHTLGSAPAAANATGSALGEGGMLLPSGDMLVLPVAPVWSLRSQKQARVIMTVAMAFFSIALTLSISGVRLSDVHTALAAPSSFEASASRQFFDTRRQVVSFYDNLRLVREVEATVDDLRQSAARDSHGHQAHPQPSASNTPASSYAPAPLLASHEVDYKANALQAEERTIL